MDKKILKAEKRKVFGRKVKILRREGIIPGNVYGKKIKSEGIQVDQKEFEEVFKETGETGLIELVLGKEKKAVLVHNLQTDPLEDTIIHVDFLQVDLKQKVSADIPVEIVGEAPAEKQGMGTLVQYIDEIEVEALPTDLPEKFEIDVSILAEVDAFISVKDLKVEKDKVKIENDPEQIIVKIEPLRKGWLQYSGWRFQIKGYKFIRNEPLAAMIVFPWEKEDHYPASKYFRQDLYNWIGVTKENFDKVETNTTIIFLKTLEIL